MLKIRQAQLEVFELSALRRFERRLVEHLRENFSKHCDGFTDDVFLAKVRKGIASAQEQGFEDERNVALFVELYLLLGEDFDNYPWAKDVLNDEFILDSGLCIDTLYEKGMQQLGIPVKQLSDEQQSD